MPVSADTTNRRRAPIIGVVTAMVVLVAGIAAVAAIRSSDCDQDPAPSVARAWNEAALDAIREEFPAPTVHARNLYHLSAVMWDVWAAYDPVANPVFVDTKQDTADLGTDEIAEHRDVAISHAAHRLLTTRYRIGATDDSRAEAFDQRLASLCLPDNQEARDFGIEAANQVLGTTRDDGSNEPAGYVDLSYAPVNPPLVVADPGADMVDPNRWQPLSLEVQITQNGQVLPGNVQEFVGPNWGSVVPFALPHDPDNGLPIDPGPPPLLGQPEDEDEYIGAVIEVLAWSSALDPASGDVVDIGPRTRGNNPLGTNDGLGHEVNPATGEPYEANIVLEADFGRAIAEFWADGPDSETPPGHWNTIANQVSDQLFNVGAESTVAMSTGEPLDRLQWDVKLGLALNGATHDAAIAAWGAKRVYDYARPISMIRHLGSRGELPEVPRLIETITEESAAPGGRHEGLVDGIGEQAVFAWRGQPDDPDTVVAGVGWIRAADWVPYQRASFVSPAFAAYVSGHSAFSRAAAEVLTAFTGDPYAPGGMFTHTVPAGGFIHEAGPDEPITLQWATYFDAADEAGLSRIPGGIHVRADDFEGRRIGSQVGRMAWDRALALYG